MLSLNVTAENLTEAWILLLSDLGGVEKCFGLTNRRALGLYLGAILPPISSIFSFHRFSSLLRWKKTCPSSRISAGSGSSGFSRLRKFSSSSGSSVCCCFLLVIDYCSLSAGFVFLSSFSNIRKFEKHTLLRISDILELSKERFAKFRFLFFFFFSN